MTKFLIFKLKTYTGIILQLRICEKRDRLTFLASVHCRPVVTCQERADLLALVCDVYLCFCHFPMWFPGLGMLLDCIDS